MEIDMFEKELVKTSLDFLENYLKDTIVVDDFNDTEDFKNYTEKEINTHKVFLQERYKIGIRLKEVAIKMTKKLSKRAVYSLTELEKTNLESLSESYSNNYFIRLEELDMRFFNLAHSIFVEFMGIGRFVELLENLNVISLIGNGNKNVSDKSL